MVIACHNTDNGDGWEREQNPISSTVFREARVSARHQHHILRDDPLATKWKPNSKSEGWDYAGIGWGGGPWDRCRPGLGGVICDSWRGVELSRIRSSWSRRIQMSGHVRRGSRIVPRSVQSMWRHVASACDVPARTRDELQSERRRRCDSATGDVTPAGPFRSRIPQLFLGFRVTVSINPITADLTAAGSRMCTPWQSRKSGRTAANR